MSVLRIDASHRLATGESSAEGIEYTSESIKTAKILLVDEGRDGLAGRIRSHLFHAGYSRICTTDQPAAAVATIYRELPDLIVLKLSDSSGVDIVHAVRSDERLASLPVLILVDPASRKLRNDALRAGATDFVHCPLEPEELTTRVRNALIVRCYQCNMATVVQQSSAQLRNSRRELIHFVARAAQLRDQHTGAHGLRVGGYAGMIARQMGIREEQSRLIEEAASLHDIGKLAVPDSILRKSERLTSDEYEQMRRHSAFGKQICDPTTSRTHSNENDAGYLKLGPCMSTGSSSELLELAGRIALTHHEWWDGTGYPDGLSGNDIPLEGRITAAADVFDALSSQRPYKPALPPEKCFGILEEGKGTQFDPKVIDAFLSVKQRVERLAVAISPETSNCTASP